MVILEAGKTHMQSLQGVFLACSLFTCSEHSDLYRGWYSFSEWVYG